MILPIFKLVSIGFLLFSVQCLKHSKFDLPERLNNTIEDDELNSLIHTYNPVDLSAGTPDLLPPSFMRHALRNVSSSLDQSVHQYVDITGYAGLRKEITCLYSKLINRSLNMMENVVVTVGATQALYLTFMTYTAPGDEWIVLEPGYGTYFGIIKMVGGKITPVPLRTNITQGRLNSGDLKFNKNELRKAFNSRTKGIVVNNPHNPTGKVFTEEELLFIAELAIKWDTLIISDEVYEWTIFDTNKHIRMASLGEHIFNRTITLNSVSKTFFATGWRVGWACGPAKLIENLKAQQTFLILSGNSHAQIASAEGLRKMRYELGRPNSYFAYLAKFLEQRRNFVINMLERIGMEPVVPQAGFYVYVKWTSIESRITDLELENGNSKDVKFVKWLIKHTGVLITLGTALHVSEGTKSGEDYFRLCFAKKNETLSRAAALLQKQFP